MATYILTLFYVGHIRFRDYMLNEAYEQARGAAWGLIEVMVTLIFYHLL